MCSERGSLKAGLGFLYYNLTTPYLNGSLYPTSGEVLSSSVPDNPLSKWFSLSHKC